MLTFMAVSVIHRYLTASHILENVCEDPPSLALVRVVRGRDLPWVQLRRRQHAVARKRGEPLFVLDICALRVVPMLTYLYRSQGRSMMTAATTWTR